MRYDTIRYIYVRSDADKMASLVYSARHINKKNKKKLKTKTD